MAAKFHKGANPKVVALVEEAKRLVDDGKTSCCDLYVRIVHGDIDKHFFRRASMGNKEVEDIIENDPGGWFYVYTIDRDGDYISQPFRDGLPEVESDIKFSFLKTSGGYIKVEADFNSGE